MPSINIDLDFFTHPKAVRLTKMLGAESTQNLIRLWCHVGKHYPDTGGATDWATDEVEADAGWMGESGAFVDCLMRLKLLHPWENGYRIHDWEDHAGHLKIYRDRAKKAIRSRWDRIKGEKHTSSNTSSILGVILNNGPSNTNAVQCNAIKDLSVTREELFSDVLLNLAREVYGLTPEGILTGWMTVQKWREDWIVEATQIAAESGKRGTNAAKYAAGIMRGWTRDGKPERHDSKSHGDHAGKPRLRTGGKFSGRYDWANGTNCTNDADGRVV